MSRIFALALAAAAASTSSAHEAPSGWEYDAACCSDRDCGVMPFNRVTPGPDGWRVRVEPGEHHYYPGALDVVVPYDSRQIRHSQDTEFHLCLTSTGHLLCLYVPPLGG